MSKIKINSDDPKANGKALEASIHETHERTVALLKGVLDKLQEGSRQWVEIVNELAAEDRRYRRELEEYRDRILIATTPKYVWIARVEQGSVVVSTPEDDAIRRRYDEEFGTNSSTDSDPEPPTSAPAAATPAAQPPEEDELPPNPYRDDDETYQYYKSLPRSGPQRPLRPCSRAAQPWVQ